MSVVAFLAGGVVGFSLGLTGGGGAIFAVPLLVYALHVAPREAIGISLAAVGATAAVGFVQRWRHGEVELATGCIFALAGMLGAPAGTWLAHQVPEPWLLATFAGLMLFVAVRMWRQTETTGKAGAAAQPSQTDSTTPPDSTAPSAIDCPSIPATCQRDASGSLRLDSPCARLLLLLGLATGVLAGLFGVGGGFVIVPALVLYSGMPIRRAIGTSLFVIMLISISGVSSHALGGEPIPLGLTAWFVGGGISGLILGSGAARRLAGPTLQRVFAVAIVLVAAMVMLRSAG